MNIYDTYFMLAAVREMPLMRRFFRDRYFPTNTNLDIFGSARVLVDFYEGNKRLAPFVMPRIGGVSILRDAFQTFELEPPNISLRRTLTVDNLKTRGFGEALNSQMTPADRESMLLLEDMRVLSDRITRREEWMAAKTMINNGCVMRHITDREDVTFEEINAQFFSGTDNPALYTPSYPWYDGDPRWRDDVRAMAKSLSQRGLPAADLIIAPDVESFIMRDEWLLKLLDNNRVEIGRIAPNELPNGTTFLGSINFGGILLNIIVSEETYEDEYDNIVTYLPAGTVIVTAPGCGHCIYGGVTQMEADEQFYTHAAARVPMFFADRRHGTKEVILTSKPLMAPKRANPWMVAKNVFS
ncbi:MAG: major capsid protein [Oscillospiraceae bacterium]|nr:major capsid protein [Oscillospiraceae bacterium]